MWRIVLDFLRYYTTGWKVRIATTLSAEDARDKLLHLADDGDMTVECHGSRAIIAYSNVHTQTTRGTPIIPILHCFLDRDAHGALLYGRIAVAPGVRIGVGFMAFVILGLFPIGKMMGTVHETFPGAGLFGAVGFVALLAWIYSLGRRDIQQIRDAIANAIAVDTEME